LHAQVADELGHHSPEIDLGGGFGMAYTSQHTPLEPAEIGEQLADIVRREFEALQQRSTSTAPIKVPRVSIEPGRAIVGPSTFTLYEVGTVKEVELGDHHSRAYVSVDG